MESENLHQHHQLQPQIVGLCSSLATQSGCGVSTFNDWSPSIIPNVSDYSTYMNEILPNSSRDYSRPKNANSTIQSTGFYDKRSFADQSAANTLQFGMMTTREETSECLPKFSDMIHKHDQLYVLDLGETSPIIEPFSYGESCGMLSGLAPPRTTYNFGHDPSTTSISNLDFSSSRGSSSLGLNLALDLLTSTNNSNGGSCSQSSYDSFGFLGEDVSLGQVHVEESSDTPSSSSNKASSAASKKEVRRTKRVMGSSSSEPKPSHEAAKKSRLTSHSPCPPFKVRKEKLGDRVAALHRLVAPFGKTDTASVLTEAIGYIQFLQNQIQKLTVPYMKSSSNSHCRTIQGTPNMEDGEEELKQDDLRSRGLCLAPLSFTSYISAYN
ncbi:transcription factor bHLH110-like [Cornus florida]|uniref:transcription factor bHLH110-like n=1 Tax=Cornus florida TaxID=4283 RepID=UPI00289E249B|nr:transcription factor bHLH110-like [Cornus florida]